MNILRAGKLSVTRHWPGSLGCLVLHIDVNVMHASYTPRPLRDCRLFSHMFRSDYELRFPTNDSSVAELAGHEHFCGSATPAYRLDFWDVGAD